jgi:putative MATE family efflux protein
MNHLEKEQSMLKTFISYSIPCILGMFLTSFITIVDGMFIGWKMGEKGLAAVNLSLPVLYILLALTIMIGVGGVTLGAQSLGKQDRTRANHYFNLALLVTILVNITAIIILLLFQDGIVRLLNAKGILAGYVRDYLGTMTFFYVFMMVNMVFTMFIRSEGKPRLSLLFGVVANTINIILDYIFIMRLGYGMKGAAVASGLSVIIAFILAMIYFLSKKSLYKFSKPSLRMRDLKQMLFLGSAEFIAQISLSMITYLLNWVVLKRIGINGVAALTIVGYVSFIQNMILTGIAVGIHPLISFYFGAKNKDKILELLSIALKAVFYTGAFIFMIVILAADWIAGIFAKNNKELLRIADQGLQLFALAFLMNGYNIIAAAYFTSLGEAKAATVISLLRNLIFVSIFIFILPSVIGNIGIWLTAPLAEGITFLIAYFWIKRSKAALQGINA